jgi:hypothetical protein
MSMPRAVVEKFDPVHSALPEINAHSRYFADAVPSIAAATNQECRP